MTEMRELCLTVCVLLLTVSLSNAASKFKRDDNSNIKPAVTVSPKIPVPAVTVDNSSQNNSGNDTETTQDTGLLNKLRNNIRDNKEMLMRTFYVLLGVTSIVIIYFGVRAWRTRRRRSKSRKYGLITTPGSDLEMEPLDRDMDDDEDMTVFEARHK